MLAALAVGVRTPNTLAAGRTMPAARAAAAGVVLPQSLTPSVLEMLPGRDVPRETRAVDEDAAGAAISDTAVTSDSAESVVVGAACAPPRPTPPMDKQTLAATAAHINALTQAAKEVGRASDALFLALYFRNRYGGRGRVVGLVMILSSDLAAAVR